MEATAMNVSPPDSLEYSSENKKISLSISNNGIAQIKTEKETFDWADKVSLPAQVAISETQGIVFLLGGFGDSGSALGRVDIYDLQGKQVKQLDLNKQVPNLKELSTEYRELTNFPWIASLDFSDDQKVLSVNVCNKTQVEISTTGEVKKAAYH